MMLGAYRALVTMGAPLIRAYLAWRLARGKEDRARFGERLGIPGLARPAGRLVWLHAASVGEALSLLPIVERLGVERPDLARLLTTGTVSSAGLLAERLPAGALHQYVPVDRPAYVRRFLEHWRPDLVLWAESEFWPVLLSQSAARGACMVLVQGRVSPSSFRGWRRAPRLIAGLLGGFALCLGQTEDDAERLRRLGAPLARWRGNLKFAAPALPADPGELARLEAALGERPRWLAASTHAGEEEIAASVHAALREAHPDLLTIVVPRHATRGAAIARVLGEAGLLVARRGAGETPDAATQVYVADTMGELGLFFRLAGIAFIGKSLAGSGGQNPLEAARLDCAVLFGPGMDNFADIARRMGVAQAARQVADGDALADAVGALLANPGERRGAAGRAHAFAAAEAHVLDAVMDELAPYLDALEAPGEKHARP